MRPIFLLLAIRLILAVQSENTGPHITLDDTYDSSDDDDSDNTTDINTIKGEQKKIPSGPNLNPSNVDSDNTTDINTIKGEQKKIPSGIILSPSNVDKTIYCRTEDGKKGVCVLFYLCDSKINTIVDDETPTTDIKSSSESLIVCTHYLEVCCLETDIEKVKNTPGSSKDVASFSPGRKSKRDQCGWSNPGAAPKLRSSDTDEDSNYAVYGDFPWMVALLKKSRNDDVWSDEDYLGGGTLIHRSVVITAAHKLSIQGKQFLASELKCRAGEWDTQTTLEDFPHQDRDVAKYIIHENYYASSLLNDVALLIMKEPFDLVYEAAHMGLACLATSLPPDGYGCYSMGWGNALSKKKETQPSILKKVPLHFVEHDKCEKKLPISSLSKFFDLHISLTCASGKKGVDTCRADEGSPLVCPITPNPGERRFAVHGMVANGIEHCGNPNVPGLYVNIPHLKSWVDEKMQKEGFDTSFYTM